MPIRVQNSNKGTFGKVLNFAGSKNYIGAAYLSTVSILKSGAGYAALASEKNIINIVSSILPDAVYYSRNDGINKLKDFNTLLIGCGLGIDFDSKNCFKRVIKNLSQTSVPTVIDADGLNILSQMKINLPQNTIITPHPAEAARLLDIDKDYVLNNMVNCAKELVKKYNCTVVLKSHRTIICDSNSVFINQHGNSALAKAGTGDVLAGIISGLLAQKMRPFEAAKLGVYLHSRAGEIASKELSEYSVLASDLPNYLSKAILEIS